MLAILNYLNAHSFPIFQPILMLLVSKFMVHRALSDKTYLLLGMLSPLRGRFAKSTSHLYTCICFPIILMFRSGISVSFRYFGFVSVSLGTA